MKKTLIFLVLLTVIAGVVFTFNDDAKRWAFASATSLQEKMVSMENKRMQIDGHDIMFLERQASVADAETIVLLHGFTLNKNNWPQFVHFLPAEFRVIAPDLPAHGESSYLPRAEYSLPTQADRMMALLETLNIQSAHLVGNSMGGAIALNMASRFPEKVRTLTLMNAAGVDDPNTESEFERMLKEGKNPLLPKTEQEAAFSLDLVMAKPPYIPGPFKSVMVTMALERYDRFAAVFQQLVDDLGKHPLADLSAMHVPTLILWGDKDRILDVANADTFAAQLPNSQTVIYQGVGHMPMLEVPKQSAADVVKFIAANK